MPGRILVMRIVALFCFPASASAAVGDDASVRLIHERGRGAERCPDETFVRSATIERLHYDPFSDDALRTLRLSVVEEGGIFRGDVRLEGVGGQLVAERQLSSPDCGDLTDAIVLAMAIALEPVSDVAEPRAGAPVVTAAIGLRRSRERELPDPLVAYAAIAGVTAVGVRPGIAPGAALELGLSRRRWTLAADVRTFLPASVAVQGGTVTSSSLLSMVLACSRISRLSLCAAVLGGVLYARGHDDLVRPQTSLIPQVGAGQRVAWDQPIGPQFRLRFQVEGGGWLVRARLTVGRQDAWAEPAGWALAGITLVGTLP